MYLAPALSESVQKAKAQKAPQASFHLEVVRALCRAAIPLNAATGGHRWRPQTVHCQNCSHPGAVARHLASDANYQLRYDPPECLAAKQASERARRGNRLGWFAIAPTDFQQQARVPANAVEAKISSERQGEDYRAAQTHRARTHSNCRYADYSRWTPEHPTHDRQADAPP